MSKRRKSVKGKEESIMKQLVIIKLQLGDIFLKITEINIQISEIMKLVDL